ncbi:MAG: sulfatase [Cyclobacteriaceae bacterium]
MKLIKNMNKHLVLLFILGIVISCKTEKEPQKPNIVMVLADDLGWAQIGCYGTDYYETPNIDQIAYEGMRFTNAYAAAPVCSPTRASILTGKYPARLHLTNFIAGGGDKGKPLAVPDWQKFLPLEEKTVAEVLKEQGYATALFGKWHLSIEKTPPESLPYNPTKQGFDEEFVTYKPAEYMPLGEWQTAEEDAHSVDTITSLSLGFMQRNQDKPFFLIVSHNTIHDPLMEQSATINKYQNKAGNDQPENHPVIAAMIERLDESTGRIIKKIEDLGIAENTIVIFYSDNGGLHKHAAQTPLRMGKGTLYEGGIRVPLIVKWPGVTQPGTSSDHLISSVDLLPTFADMAGFSSHELAIDGLSFTGVLQGQKDSFNREALYWHFPHYHNGMPGGVVRAGDYKLIERFEPMLLNQPGQLEVYNLAEDIGETTNLLDSLPEKAEELQQMLHQWRDQVGAQMMTVKEKRVN